MTDENNELILSAMGILTHAGDARLHTKEALKYVQALQFEKADACLKEAKKEITQAHAAQTEIIQAEATACKAKKAGSYDRYSGGCEKILHNP